MCIEYVLRCIYLPYSFGVPIIPYLRTSLFTIQDDITQCLQLDFRKHPNSCSEHAHEFLKNVAFGASPMSGFQTDTVSRRSAKLKMILHGSRFYQVFMNKLSFTLFYNATRVILHFTDRPEVPYEPPSRIRNKQVSDVSAFCLFVE